MKKKNLLTKSVVGLTAASIIASSCSSPSVWSDTDESSDSSSQFADEGSQVINLRITAEEEAYLAFLKKLSDDIIKEPAVAREFAKDPNAFVKQYGYEGKVNLDEGMLKLILALGDEDINTAINQNDVTTVIALMERKGLLDDVTNSDLKIKFEDDNIKQIYERIGIDYNNQTIGSKNAYTLVVAVPIYVAAVYYVAVAAGVWAWVSVSTEFWGTNKTESDQRISNTLERNIPLKIFSLKGQDANTYVAVDKYVTEQTEKLMSIIKEKYPETIEKIGETPFEQLLKYSIVTNQIEKK